MSNSDWHQRVRHEAETFMQEGLEAQDGACKAGDLKGLLHAIVEQISDADRRHSETLSQMQDRLAAMGQEARTLRTRVPENFQPAFERIEAGMSELASRIAEVKTPAPQDVAGYEAVDMPPVAHPALKAAFQPAVQTSATPPAAPSEPPMALRSALDQNQQSQSRKRDEEMTRGYAGVDTFDVIESLPGNVSDPWDRDSAEALTGLYDPISQPYKPESVTSTSEPEVAQVYQAVASAPPSAMAASTADQSWFETRFAEIATHIDQALADVRPDQSFFAIGQRLDQFERHFGQAFENVATRGDVESVRLIEAHMSELVDHLENTNSQLARIDALENQIAGIAEKLEDVHRAALAGTPASGIYADNQPAIDVTAIARAAAQEAASQFAAMPQTAQPGLDIDEMRSLFDRTLSEVRLGDENTSVLLDTLQQAMIRLLDRVDAIELNQHRSAESQVQPQRQAKYHDYASDQPRFSDSTGRAPYAESENYPSLDAAVAAVASAKPSSPFEHAPGGNYDFADEFAPRDAHASAPQQAQAPSQQPASMRSSEKLRQDFIADARRAKMRLANENAGPADGVVINNPEDIEPPKAAKSPVKPAAKVQTTVANPAKATPASAISPRVVALMLALVVAGGAWFLMPGFSSKRASMTGAANNPSMVSKSAASKPPAAGTADKMSESNAQAPGAKPSMAPPPDADFTPPANSGKDQPELNLHSTTHGQIVPDDTPHQGTSVPMQGIAVSTERHMEAADIERARRQQAMASVSSNLGLAAGEFAQATQTALVPDAAAQPSPGAAYEVTARKENGPLDMPPATVGPLSLRLAAANGDPSAEFEVGARLAEGKGTTQNFKDAAKWYQRSASKGFVQAQYRLGTLYERGLGMKADQARAEDWYTRAAEQGNVKAMHNLAVLSANQRGGSPDYATAASWFGKAAEFGLADSQFNLAVLYENGLGVPEDLKLAYKWLSLASRSGDKEAVRRRDILKGKLPAGDLAAAEALVASFKAASADKMANDARTAGEAWKRSTTTDENG